jgi:prepilin-type N-terminal cleavage/methylation domain-containing protein
MKILHRSKKNGFTLIELLVVIAIIAILTGIIITGLVGSRAKARDAKRASDLSQIALAIEQYFDRCDQYPSNAIPGLPDISNTSLPPLTANNGCPNGVTLANFISVMPADPTGGSTYIYQYSINSNTTPIDYVIYATFESTNSVLSQSAPNPSWFPLVVFNCGNQATTPSVAKGLDYCVRPN